MVQLELGFYDSRNKSPTHLGRSVTRPPNDPQFPCLSPGGYTGLLKVKIIQISRNFEIWENLMSICVKGYRNQHIEGGNVVVQLELGFYDSRNKSPTHLNRSVTRPPNDSQFPCLSPGGYTGLLKVKIIQISRNFEIWENLMSICVKGYRNQHIEGGNVEVQLELGFYDSRNKSPTHLGRSVTGPPNDPQFPCLSPGGYTGLLMVKLIQISRNFEIWENLMSICVKGYRNQAT